MNNIPSEFIIDSIDSYIAKYSTASKKIYWVALTAVVATLIALPFIYVNVSVQEAGVIRPIAEKTEIRANISELVDSVFVKEGQAVNKGDTILTLQRSNPDFQIGYQQKRVTDMQEHLSDLVFLAKGQKPETFRSASRKQEYILFLQQMQEQETNAAKAQKDLERNQTLYNNENTLTEIWNSPQAMRLAYMKKEYIDKNSKCYSCGQFQSCFDNRNRCWTDIIKAYGDDHWDFPDPRCKMAPKMIQELSF